jgi:hypothetical protein
VHRWPSGFGLQRVSWSPDGQISSTRSPMPVRPVSVPNQRHTARRPSQEFALGLGARLIGQAPEEAAFALVSSSAECRPVPAGGRGALQPHPVSWRLEVAPRPNCSTPSFVASLPSRWTLRTPVARLAGRPGSSPRWVWFGCRPDRALRPGRCPRTGACSRWAPARWPSSILDFRTGSGPPVMSPSRSSACSAGKANASMCGPHRAARLRARDQRANQARRNRL